MLKKRLIPKLQMRTSSFGGSRRLVLVTTVGFGESLEIGDPASQAKIYEAQAADELILVDLDASADNRDTLIDVIRRTAEEVFMPLTVGGGVRTVDDFRTLLANGADKISINTAACDDPSLISAAAALFGKQCVVLSIDYKKNDNGAYSVWTRGGKQETGRDPLSWAVEGEKLGAGEILLTSIDRDGSRSGLDCELTRRVTEAVGIPVITSGGCGLARHFVDGFTIGRADAVSAGTYFCFKDENPMQTRAQIANSGTPIRLHGQRDSVPAVT